MAVSALGLGMVAASAEERDPDAPRPMFITRYLVKGARALPPEDVQAAVYPHLGPGRLPEDVDKARAALQQAYHDKGYKSVSVIIPMQRIRRGVVTLEVEENPVGRVRVRGAQFTSPSELASRAKSLEEGKPINFDDFTRDVVAMNRSADRTVTPSLSPGIEPGTFDVDLTVEDQLPLHGSLELNNRYSADTSKLRLNGAISYGNLWQKDHTLGLSFQIAPENIEDAEVYSAYYLVPVGDSDDWLLMAQATRQDSNVSTLGGAAVAGRGRMGGLRAIRNLPGSEKHSHSVSLGVDYKKFDEGISFGANTITAPVTYYPFGVQYSGFFRNERGRTEANLGLTWSFRGLGSDPQEFDDKRSGADGSFVHLRGEVSRVRDMTNGMQWFARLQGQAAGQPLVNTEQFAAGGLGTVRGFLESETLGDNGIAGTIEVRSAPLWQGDDEKHELRVHGFLDAGAVSIYQPLPDQSRGESLAGIGVGARARWDEHFHATIDTAYPLTSPPTGGDRKFLTTFRLWGEF